MPDFGLKPDDLFAVTETFKNVPQVLAAAVFGSRAKGDHKPYSDVDIALYGDLGLADVESVRADLEELPLVYTFDVVAYGLVKNLELRRHIERVGIKIYERGKE